MFDPQGLSYSRFLVRWMLAIIFVMAGFWKVFELGADQHAAQFFVAAYADNWIPEFLLWSLGYIIPYWELIAGCLLAAGYRSREVLFSLGCLLLITTYGHALKQALFDIDGFTFTRLILILIGLLIPASFDILSLDNKKKSND